MSSQTVIKVMIGFYVVLPALELQPGDGIDEPDANSQDVARVLDASADQGADLEGATDAVG